MTYQKFILAVGLCFQFLFTVSGGGMLIAGLIAGISTGWVMSGDNPTGRVYLLLVIFGGILFLIGIGIAFILFRRITSAYNDSSEIKKEGGDFHA